MYSRATQRWAPWKLNENKSTFGDGAGKTTLVVWEKAGDQQKCTVDGTDADGNKTHSVWTGKMDGKFYAVTGESTGRCNAHSRER